MTTLLNVNRVKYQCSCGTFKPLCFLYFCRHCLKIKCKDCVILEVDCRFCPSCYEHLQSHEAITRKNRCQNCFSCPCCNHTLVTRATNTSATLPTNLNTTSDSPNISSAGDADDSISNSTNVSGLQTPSKKVYYLACSVCRWTTRDIHLPDQPALNSWKAQDNVHEGRFNELLQHYKQIATREKQERDRKRYSTVKLRSSMTPTSATTANRSTDKYGLLAPLTRRGIRTGGMLKTPTLTESPTTTSSSSAFPKPSEPIENLEPLDENFFLNQSFDFNNLTTITQRLNSVEIQPLTIDHVYPLAKHFTSKQSKRCKECDHNVLKPEPSPKLIKFRLHQMALFFIPETRIWHHPTWSTKEKNPCVLSIINQLDEQTTLKLYTLDEIRDENTDTELIQRINQLDENILTSKLSFPIEKERSVQLHAHVESNETDTKIDEELRQKDVKDLVIYRKFAKIAIRCFIQIKQNDVKQILAAFIVEHRVVGISSIVSASPTATTNPIAQNIRHIILIDFGSIDEPALPLHSALA